MRSVPERPASAVSCTWCPALATGNMSGTGGGHNQPARRVPHCDAEVCWERTYRIAITFPSREWWIIEQSEGLF